LTERSGEEVLKSPEEGPVPYGAAKLLRNHRLAVPTGTLPQENLLPVTEQRRKEPELDAEILQPASPRESRTRFGNEDQTPISAVEASATPAQSGNLRGEQQILFGNPISPSFILEGTFVEVNQQIGRLVGEVLRLLKHQIQGPPAAPHETEIFRIDNIPPLIFPPQDDLPVQRPEGRGAQKEEEACSESTLFHNSSIHYNRNAQNTT
jgi:hypothetical protein